MQRRPAAGDEASLLADRPSRIGQRRGAPAEPLPPAPPARQVKDSAVAEKGAFAWGRNGYVLRIAAQERALITRLLDELGELLRAPETPPATARLFPVVHPRTPSGKTSTSG